MRLNGGYGCTTNQSPKGKRKTKTVTSWLESKLFLKVSATKIKVVQPTKGQFLEFTFCMNSQEWKCRLIKDRKKRLYTKI